MKSRRAAVVVPEDNVEEDVQSALSMDAFARSLRHQTGVTRPSRIFARRASKLGWGVRGSADRVTLSRGLVTAVFAWDQRRGRRMTYCLQRIDLPPAYHELAFQPPLLPAPPPPLQPV